MTPLFRQTLQEALRRGAALELASPRAAAGIDGRRLGRRAGNALEFAEYREYQPGDDLRRLDWSVFARSEQLMVKLYSEEVDPRCDILLDHSASMSAGAESSGSLKAAAAFGLAAALAMAAANAGFSLAVWHAEECLKREPFPHHPAEWSNTVFSSPANPGDALAATPGLLQSRGIRIAVSDLLWPEAPEQFLRRLADGAKRVVLIELLSREDLAPEGSGNLSLADAETAEERELFFDDALLRRYRGRLARHRELWKRTADEFGIGMIHLTAEEFLPSWNLQELFRSGILK